MGVLRKELSQEDSRDLREEKLKRSTSAAVFRQGDKTAILGVARPAER